MFENGLIRKSIEKNRQARNSSRKKSVGGKQARACDGCLTGGAIVHCRSFEKVGILAICRKRRDYLASAHQAGEQAKT